MRLGIGFRKGIADPAAARRKAAAERAMAAAMPAYAAVLAREAVADAGVTVAGSPDAIGEQLTALEQLGVTDFTGMLFGTDQQQRQTIDALAELRATRPRSRDTNLAFR